MGGFYLASAVTASGCATMVRPSSHPWRCDPLNACWLPLPRLLISQVVCVAWLLVLQELQLLYEDLDEGAPRRGQSLGGVAYDKLRSKHDVQHRTVRTNRGVANGYVNDQRELDECMYAHSNFALDLSAAADVRYWGTRRRLANDARNQSAHARRCAVALPLARSSDNAVMELPVIYAGVKNEDEEDVASSPASSIPRYSFSLLGRRAVKQVCRCPFFVF